MSPEKMDHVCAVVRVIQEMGKCVKALSGTFSPYDRSYLLTGCRLAMTINDLVEPLMESIKITWDREITTRVTGDIRSGMQPDDLNKEKIRQVFDVDVTDIESGNLADIFERIHKAS